jgi:hypothetical protein
MTKWQAFRHSFHKNVIMKKKYKAFITAFIDPSYRRSINRLRELTKDCTREEVQYIGVEHLVHGHKIIYVGYALGLFAVAKDLPMIRVVYDVQQNRYVVVDGNHRLPALLSYARAIGASAIQCEVML